jgi:large subunit ribosomal protein L37Ae
MGKTKAGSASRFGSRYGAPLKQIVSDIEKVQKKAQQCPRCGRKALRRRGYAVWECRKCGSKIAGGAYYPQTEVGSIAERIVKKGEKHPEVLEAREAAPEKSE